MQFSALERNRWRPASAEAAGGGGGEVLDGAPPTDRLRLDQAAHMWREPLLRQHVLHASGPPKDWG